MAFKTQQEREQEQLDELKDLVERARTAPAKTYTYQRGKFNWDVTGQGIICLAIIAWAIWAIAVGFVRPLAVVVLVVAAYGAWNTFGALAYCHSVTVTDDAITFECYGRERTYPLKDIHDIRIREFPSTYKLYVRMDDDNLLHGRYWVRGWWMDDGDELYYRLLDLEVKLNPNSLKATARANNALYYERQKEKEKAEHEAVKSKTQRKKEARKHHKN